MVSRILFGTLLWIRTKVLLLVASCLFIWHLSKSLKSMNTNAPKGENLSKNKAVVSGSSDLVKDDLDDDEYLTVDDMKIDVEEIETALKKLLGTDLKESLESEPVIPIYVLDLGKENDFFYSLNRKSFIQIRNSTEVCPVFEDSLKLKSVPGFYVINNEVFNIDPKKVICIGWN